MISTIGCPTNVGYTTLGYVMEFKIRNCPGRPSKKTFPCVRACSAKLVVVLANRCNKSKPLRLAIRSYR